MTDIDVWRTIRELQAAVNELRDGVTDVREYIRQCEAAAEEGLARLRAMTESSTQRNLTPVSGPADEADEELAVEYDPEDEG